MTQHAQIPERKPPARATVRPLLRESSGRVSSLLAYYALGPPADYLIVGWLQRRFVYSLTAATGDGKTAIALLILEAR